MARHPRAELHKDPDRVTSTGMFRYALEYFAAGVVVDDELGDAHEYLMYAPMPAAFLLARSIELSLKAFVLEKGGQPSQLFSVGHDLLDGLGHAESLGFSELAIFDAEERELLGIVNTLYSNKEYEYSVTGSKVFPIFGPMTDLAKKPLVASAEVVPSAKKMFERLKAGKVLQRYLP